LATIQGIDPGISGQHLTIVAVGTGQVDMTYNDAAAAAGKKVITFVTVGTTSLAPGGVATLVYDGVTSRWLMESHDQGAWITPTFAAGDYTVPSGTITVAAGDVVTCKYLLRGHTLHFRFAFATIDTTGSPAYISRLIPGGYSAVADVNTFYRATDAAGAVAEVGSTITATTLSFYSNISGAGWTAGAGRALAGLKILEVA
jgi:hypothetical protein